MGLKMPVPEPTEKDFSLSRIGFDVWYEHDSECVAGVGKPEDWRQEVLSLIRLANYYRKLAENSRLRSELAAIREAGDEEIDALRYRVDCTVPESKEETAALDSLTDIAKSRGARIRELEEDVGCYEAMKEGFSSRLADVEKERDEAIYLLRWLRRLAEGKHIEFRDGTGHAETNRLLELTAK